MTRFVSLLGLVAAMAACGGGPERHCGVGTVLKDTVCVPVGDAASCGAGTALVDGVCYGGAGVDVGATTDAATTDAATTDAATTDAATTDAATTDAATTDAATTDAATTDAATTDGSPDAAACAPYCVGRNCGDDGCGGSCGSCTSPDKPICDTAQGVCVATCVPQCTGKTCGDNGCGGSCGSCVDGLTCLPQGLCVPPAWTCNPAYFAAADACDCKCGAWDPDCADATTVVAGCGSFEACDKSGKCVSAIPAGWTCLGSQYAALDACDCGCGAPDPDCATTNLPVSGCKTGEACGKTGTCEACKPDCSGKTCGDDGCGGSCGTCDGGKLCSGGACVDPCQPKPLACQTATCGDDGCGGSCGICMVGSSCVQGQCQWTEPPKPDSCQGSCGSLAPSGCSCAIGCAKSNTCCSDYGQFCKCKPACTGKQCGDNGCGGTCGSCDGSKPWCGADQLCSAKCTPQCTGKACGADGCGGVCGTCAAGSTCTGDFQCVPANWQCPLIYFADGEACDCGCGAPDPDCTNAKLLVFGCPTTQTACDTTGVCKVAFCGHNADCGVSQWCVGSYAAGGGAFKGVCSVPESKAKAPGAFCTAGVECATGVCLGGLCRTHCTGDGDCPGSERCLGMAVSLPGASQKSGYMGVCTGLLGSGKTCTSQASCEPGVEVCTALIDPISFGPKYLCDVGSSGGGKSCAMSQCPSGQVCAATAGGPVCGLTCLGGSKDCPGGATCGSTVFNNHGTTDPADDPKVAVCVPK